MSEQLKRRNISGVYIFDTFPSEERRQPTCIEDCRPSTRHEWCMTKGKECLCNTISILADSFRDLVAYLHGEGCVTDEQRKEMERVADNIVDRARWNWAEHELADQVDTISEKIRLLADACGVERKGGEE